MTKCLYFIVFPSLVMAFKTVGLSRQKTVWLSAPPITGIGTLHWPFREAGDLASFSVCLLLLFFSSLDHYRCKPADFRCGPHGQLTLPGVSLHHQQLCKQRQGHEGTLLLFTSTSWPHWVLPTISSNHLYSNLIRKINIISFCWLNLCIATLMLNRSRRGCTPTPSFNPNICVGLFRPHAASLC